MLVPRFHSKEYSKAWSHHDPCGRDVHSLTRSISVIVVFVVVVVVAVISDAAVVYHSFP